MTAAAQLCLLAPLSGVCAECGGRAALGLYFPTCSRWPGDAPAEHPEHEVCGCIAPHEGRCPTRAATRGARP